MRQKNLSIVFFLFLLTSSISSQIWSYGPVGANGVTIYVPGDYPTIQEAVDNADPGDTVYVSSGTYMETVNISKSITLQGQDRATTFINGMGDIGLIISSDDVDIVGFSIFNSTEGVTCFTGFESVNVSDCLIYFCDNGIYLWGCDFPVIQGCSIYENNLMGVFMNMVEGADIQDCEFNLNGESGLGVLNSNFLYVGGCEFNNNSANGAIFEASHDIDFEGCSMYGNEDSGVTLDASQRVTITECNSSYNFASGIWLASCIESVMMGCELFGNTYDGLTAECSDAFLVKDCTIYGNEDSGIYFIGACDLARIACCEIFDNLNNGIFMAECSTATLFNVSSFLNAVGLWATSCNELYVSGSRLTNNYGPGVYLSMSEGVITNTNMSDNGVNGAYAEFSRVLFTWSQFVGNQGIGLNSFFGMVNAANCWWGDDTGPYHPTENPSGTGDQVSDDITFMPWQTLPFQPDTLISDFRYHGPFNNWHMIYPSDDPGKPLVLGPAMLSDWTASGLLYSKLTSVTEGVDTNPLYVNQATGRPVGDPGEAVATFGGPDVNLVAYYGENAGGAPVHFVIDGDRFYFKYANGTSIPGADLPISVINHGEDMFLIEIFKDPDGRYLMIFQGFGWKGSYAAGKFFDRVINSEMGLYTFKWIIVKWEDVNGDGYVNAPGDGDLYTIVDLGN
jgi:parallel beta-helix repeat protein